MSPDADVQAGRQPGAELLEFSRRFAADWAERVLDPADVVDFATRAVPHASGVGLTLLRRDRPPTTLAASNDIAAKVDAIEYEVGEGPCLEAIEYDDIIVANDLATESRWPKFCERALRETPVRSMFGARIHLTSDERGALNFYALDPHAFGDLDVGIGVTMSTVASLTIRHAAEQRRRENLELALESSRVIGMAMGILMSSRLVTAEEAFNLLRRASQESNRKLRDVATDVMETGALPERHRRNG